MIFAFEEIGPDLARPPIAARRALLGAGVAMPLDTWRTLALPHRQTIALEGTKDHINELTVKNAVSSVLKRVRFMGPVRDPPLDAVPQQVVDSLRALRPLTLEEWRGLRPLDRYTLVALAANSRLLYRAIEEMTSGPASSLGAAKLRPWVGPLAHAEVRMTRAALGEVASGRLQGGKAIVLARAAGVRAARSAHEIVDGYAEKYAGPVELDARLDAQIGGYVWQAHVSSADGEFLSGPSMLAAATAAVALRDAIAQNDPAANVGGVALIEAMWSVGSGAFGDEATIAMNAKAFRPAPAAAASGPRPAQNTGEPPARSGVPVWVALLLVLSTLLAFAAAGLTLHRHL
ncbi:MAG TPA: nitrate reductase associated protein [Polyangiaceae bacterium]|jgi:molybdenum cofactor biosynthesis enzyme